jgi:hypothetical protein
MALNGKLYHAYYPRDSVFNPPLPASLTLTTAPSGSSAVSGPLAVDYQPQVGADREEKSVARAVSRAAQACMHVSNHSIFPINHFELKDAIMRASGCLDRDLSPLFASG